jgi:hypothetical protein
MKIYETEAGTPVVDMTEAEHGAFLEREVVASVGMSSEEFVGRVKRGEVDWDDPDSFYAAGVLGLGQNGHRGHT